MSIKKVMLLASAALAVVALAAPAGASALEFKDAGVPAAGQEVSASGTAKFSALGSGIECTVLTTAKVTPTSLDITKFEITTATCVSFGTPYSNCEVATDNATVPWTAALGSDASGPFTTISSGTIDGTLKSKAGKTCFTTKNDITLTDVFLRPLKKISPLETGSPIVGLEIGGTVKVHTALGESTASALGTLTLTTGSGTFEIS